MSEPTYTPMIQQYLEIKQNHDDAILFFRLGDFYEMFFQDALVASKALDIQLTGRDAGAKDRVPMCGVPYHSAESYIKRLMDQGFKVAIAEQVEEATGQKLVKREVIRILTPGTHLDESSRGDHHIASVTASDHYYVVAYLNVLTGRLFSEKIWLDVHALSTELAAHEVKEVVLQKGMKAPELTQMLERMNILISHHTMRLDEAWITRLSDALPTDLEKKNVHRLVSYLYDTQKRALMYLKPCQPLHKDDAMVLDGTTLRHLELLKNERMQTEQGSLFALLNRTQTALGARFLKRQLMRPLKVAPVIEARYDMIDRLNTEFMQRETLKEALRSVYDIERILTKLSNHTIKPRDFTQLRDSLKVAPVLKTTLESLTVPRAQHLLKTFPDVQSLTDILVRELKAEVPLTTAEGGIFNDGVHGPLDEVRTLILKGDDFLETLAEEEREKTGIKKLKIGMNSVFGYYIEVPKSQSDILDGFDDYTRKQTLVNAERFITPTLKAKEKMILQAADDQVRIEKDLFEGLIERAEVYMHACQTLADIIAEMDFYVAMSDASEALNLSRPTLHEMRAIAIEDSVHPVIQALRPEEVFVKNDIVMDQTTDILLITGPNMAGKSTYMRQLALTIIMAQIGSFVPAASATLPIFDQIFTRIGASDDLIRGQSTFMVEMLEAKRALDKATDQSLILFDEMGRGTSTYDGLSLAWSLLEYVHETLRAKLIFSTHYHELTALDETLQRLKNIHVSATQKEGVMTFSHLVKDGPTDESFGIEVAAMAGLPKALIKRAQTLLKSFEKTDHDAPPTLFDFSQEEAEDPEILTALNALNLDDLSPIDALNWLYEWKKKS